MGFGWGRRNWIREMWPCDSSLQSLSGWRRWRRWVALSVSMPGGSWSASEARGGPWMGRTWSWASFSNWRIVALDWMDLSGMRRFAEGDASPFQAGHLEGSGQDLVG